jgi:enoyl-CoA hydratase/carnithine racemase
MGVLVEKKERLVRITWERPPLNVLDVALLRELDHVLADTAMDPGVDVAVVQGAGERAFSAGVDVRDHTPDKVPEMLDVVHGVVRKLLTLPQVTIAAVRGICLGGACEIASSCDLIIASEESSFATPEIFVGCYPPVALARFSSLIGYHRAAEMILTGRRFPAHEARAMGLINRSAKAAQSSGSPLRACGNCRGKILIKHSSVPKKSIAASYCRPKTSERESWRFSRSGRLNGAIASCLVPFQFSQLSEFPNNRSCVNFCLNGRLRSEDRHGAERDRAGSAAPVSGL